MKLAPCTEWLFKAEHLALRNRVRAVRDAGEFHLRRDGSIGAGVQTLALTRRTLGV